MTSAAAAKKRILIIDNEPASTRMLRLTLERHDGFEVCELNDPTNALTAAGTFRPDLILLDVEMPVFSGGDVARRLRSVPGLKEVPVVFMTSLVTEGEAAGPMYTGGSRVLAKPVTMAKLVGCITDLLGVLCTRTATP